LKTLVFAETKHLKVLNTMVFLETKVFLEYFGKTLLPNTEPFIFVLAVHFTQHAISQSQSLPIFSCSNSAHKFLSNCPIASSLQNVILRKLYYMLYTVYELNKILAAHAHLCLKQKKSTYSIKHGYGNRGLDSTYECVILVFLCSVFFYLLIICVFKFEV
jgi:hypothetical protein